MNIIFFQLHTPRRKIEVAYEIECNMSHKILLQFILFQTIQNTALRGVCLSLQGLDAHNPHQKLTVVLTNDLSMKDHWLELKLPFYRHYLIVLIQPTLMGIIHVSQTIV
jgi:hypothetical protein